MATTAPETQAAMAPRPFRVTRRARETADTWTLELEPVQGDPLQVEPGQFTMLYAFGVGEVPISVSGEPGGPLVHTVRAVGAVTEAICAAGEETVLGVRGPLGNAWPLGSGGDAVVVAGGIGLAPLRGVVYELVRRREAFGEAALLYGGRTPADLLYRDELDRWRSTLQVDVTVDAAEHGWEGKVGFVAKLVGSARFDPATTTAFVCGPEIMMRTSAEALLERGVPAERIFVSMERNMQCGVGLCGHCQLGPTLICRDGPVYRWDEVERLMGVREL
ncbi:MAG TPA: FAD/NAD(P)-binding protein [Gaiellaceae bacterium]|nr:FAD/NAD(P)-binding protein [Gaiellaceae bacterium]